MTAEASSWWQEKAAQWNEVQPTDIEPVQRAQPWLHGQIADIVLCLLTLDTEEREARRWLICFPQLSGSLDNKNEHSYKGISKSVWLGQLTCGLF